MPKTAAREPQLASELSDAELAELEAAADVRLSEEKLSMRWPRASLNTVRQAAKLHGVPYQTYVKQVAVRQAITDLKDAAAAGIDRPEG